MDIVSTIRTKKIIRFESRSTVVADDIIILMFNGFNDQLNDLITFGQTWLCVCVYENCLCYCVLSVSGCPLTVHPRNLCVYAPIDVPVRVCVQKVLLRMCVYT